MKILIQIITLVLLTLNAYGQEYSIDSLFTEFKHDIEIEQRVHGRIKWDNETRIAFYSLLKEAPIDSLTNYINDSNAAVRSFMFLGLAHKNADSSLLQRVFNQYQDDTTIFTSNTEWSVNGYIKMIMGAKNQGKLRKIDYSKEIARLNKKPLIFIPGVDHGIIIKDSLLSLDKLQCSESGFEVLSFTLSSEKAFATSNSNVLTDQMRDIIRQTKPGDWIRIHKIKMRLPDKSWRWKTSLIFRIK